MASSCKNVYICCARDTEYICTIIGTQSANYYVENLFKAGMIIDNA